MVESEWLMGGDKKIAKKNRASLELKGSPADQELWRGPLVEGRQKLGRGVAGSVPFRFESQCYSLAYDESTSKVGPHA